MSGRATPGASPTAAGPPPEIPPGRLDDPPAAVYVHIPFCVRKCPYCDFASGPVGLDLRRSHLEALRAEIKSSRWAGSAVRTVYLGGGTPSELSVAELAELTGALESGFDLTGVREWTVECNPGTARPPKLEAFARLGVNRLSLGVQSFQDRHLRTLGRIHGAEESRRFYRWAREAGFDNISLDLIFALPGQTLDEWKRDLDEALEMAPEHLSLYNLTIEPGTEFHRRLLLGRLEEAEEDLAADMYECAIDRCAEAGLGQYEISNFARPGRECLHSQTYWSLQPFLGFGISAASYVDGTRWSNTDDFALYATGAPRGEVARKVEEKLSGRHALAEAVMVGLRTRRGVRPAELRERFGFDPETIHRQTLWRLFQDGLLERRGEALALTRRGILLADGVCALFLE